MIYLSEAEYELLRRVAETQTVSASELRVRRDYSGRGMFGKTCLAIDSDGNQAIIGLVLADALGSDRAAEIVGSGEASDQMGLGIVVYWPQVVVTDYPGHDV